MSSVMIFAQLSLLAGCKKSVDDGIHVPSDAPWYDTVKLELESPYDDIALAYGRMHAPVYLNDSLYVLVTGQKLYNYFTAMNDYNFDYNDYMINSLLKYDMEGNLIEEIALEELTGLDNLQVSAISEYDGKLKVNAIATDMNTYMTESYCAIINPKSGKLESVDPCNIGESFGTELEYVARVGDYEVNSLRVDGMGDTNYQLVITRGAEVINTIDVAQKTGIYFWDINQYITVDDDTLVMRCYSDDGNMTATLKPSTGELSLSRDSIDALDRFSIAQDGKSYAVDSEGVWQLNKDLEVEPVFGFTDTFINANDASNGSVTYNKDGKTILFVEDSSLSATLTNYTVYVITKAKKNPNAGKTILDVFVMSDSLSYSEAEAVMKFNSTNPDYFAEVRFADTEYVIKSEDENDKINSISNQLMIDIMSGDGPDVILDGASVDQLNNHEYFVDLNQFVNGSNGIDKSQYFSQIFDNAVASDGALYQIPVSFSIGGVLAYKSDVAETQVGFTFDEYNQFVDLACNGKNPIAVNKLDYFSDCIARGYVDYMTDSKVDFNKPEFIALAEYTNENIPDKVEPIEDDGLFVIGYENPLADGPIYTTIENSETFVYQVCVIHEPFGMYGYPGVTGNDGPTAYVNSSAAISVTIEPEMQNVAWDFIKTMLSEDVQMKEQSGNPVNITAYTYNAEAAVGIMNEQYDSYLSVGMDETQLAADGMFRTDEAIVDYLVDIAKSVTSVNSIDTSIRIIIYEEMAPYFANQKSIDSVIQTLNDRVQTVIDERGGV